MVERSKSKSRTSVTKGSQMLETSSSQDVLSNLEFIKIWALWFSFAGQIKVLPKEPSLKIWFRTKFPYAVFSEPIASGDLVHPTTSPIENIMMSVTPSLLRISIFKIGIPTDKVIVKTT